MTHAHDPDYVKDIDDVQAKARLVRRPNGEDSGFTYYPLIVQTVDDIKEAFPDALENFSEALRDRLGRAFIYPDEVHNIPRNNDAGRRLVEGMARDLRNESPTSLETRALAYEASAERLDAAGKPSGARHARAMAVKIRADGARHSRAHGPREGGPDDERF